MGRKGNWLSSVKKALSPDTKEKKTKKAEKSKKKWFGKEKQPVSEPPRQEEAAQVSDPHALPAFEDVKLAEAEDEQTKPADDVAVATTVKVEDEQMKLAYDEAVATTAATDTQVTVAAAVVRLPMPPRFAGKSAEEIASIKIQTAFRGYLARRALRALRGLVRLKSLVDGPTSKRQTANTLKCMQTLFRVQSQIQSRRLRMLEENRALQTQLLQKRAKELECLKMGEEWDDSLQSKERIEANLLHKYEAAMRRERALAYSYTHQQTWKKSSKPANLLFMDPTNPHWGWSWLERWMSAEHPLEYSQTTLDKESIKTSGGDDIVKSFAHHQLTNSDPNPSSPTSLKKPHFSPKSTASLTSKKTKTASPRGSTVSQDDGSRSTFSMQTDRNNRRHTIGGGSSIRDDESLASSQTLPSYMVPTQSARAKLRLASPLGIENGDFNSNNINNGNSDNMPQKGLAKKRLSFPQSPARARRHLGPLKAETSFQVAANGGNVVVRETVVG